MPRKKKEETQVKQEKPPKFDAQAEFEGAIRDRSQQLIIPREYEKEFEYLSEWDFEGRPYKVYQVIGAGADHVKIGFMPVKNA